MSDIAPIFPLPNTVFFPGIVLPLHIFEHRYRNMINDIDEYDKNIIISYGYFNTQEQFVPSKISSIGKVANIQNYEDGKKDIIIIGNDYVEIETPKITNRNYLITEYKKIKIENEFEENEESILKDKLIRRLHKIALVSLNYTANSLSLMNAQLSLDSLINRIIFYYLYPSTEQQKLLEMKSLNKKCNYITSYLKLILNELERDLLQFNIPKKMVKKLN